jgi:hypothetical protein
VPLPAPLQTKFQQEKPYETTVISLRHKHALWVGSATNGRKEVHLRQELSACGDNGHYPDACLIVEALLTEIIGVPVKDY